MLMRRIEGATRVYGKPENWDDEQNGSCVALAVREEVHGGIRFMVSAWEPTPEELEAIKAGASIHLMISAPQHPVVAMTVGPVPA